MIKLYFVSGPSRSTICELKYTELLIRVMCLESGDDPECYSASKLDIEIKEVLGWTNKS